MKVVGMRKFSKGQIRAYFNVEHEGFLMRDFKLMESSSGYWVSFPKRSYTKGNETKWEPTVEMVNKPDTPEGKKLINLLSAMARDVYQGAK
jgi:DNA-binding cell septation regulator SpoVG